MTPLARQETHSVGHLHLDIPDFGRAAAWQAEETGQSILPLQPTDILVVCVRQGNLVVQTDFIPHPIELKGGEAIFLMNPRASWSVQWIPGEGANWYTLTMGVERFHQVLQPGFQTRRLEQAPAASLRELMKLIPVGPALLMGFEQLLYAKLQAPFHAIFAQAKFLEILSLLLDAAFGQPMETCPVAMSPTIEHKLRQVRHHIMDHIDQEPDADHLAITYDLPRQTLREGFRHMYGKTIHQFYADYKLEWAMQKLTAGDCLVKEIAFEVGYQNPSHFITAFKKKFGFTPKQFLKQEVPAG